jgi:hypothetical protein
MSITPEGKTKSLIKRLLDKWHIASAKDSGKMVGASQGWYYMPAQNAFGVTGIPDYIGHFQGKFFAIEAKAPGKKPTGLQALQIAAIIGSSGAVFVVDGSETLHLFEMWLKEGK